MVLLRCSHFSPNTHNRHPIAHQCGWDMRCCLLARQWEEDMGDFCEFKVIMFRLHQHSVVYDNMIYWTMLYWYLTALCWFSHLWFMILMTITWLTFLVEGAIIALSLDGPGWFIWSIYNTTQVLVRLGKIHTNRRLILKNDNFIIIMNRARQYFVHNDYRIILAFVVSLHCYMHIEFQLINLSPPSIAYMHQWIGPAMVQMMACRLFGAMPLSKLMLG